MEHVICDSCIEKSIGSLDLPSKVAEVSVKRIRNLLSIFRKLNGLNLESLNDVQVRVLSGLKKENLSEVSSLSGVSVNRVFRLYVYCRLGVGQRAVGAFDDVDHSWVSKQFKEDIPKVMEAMTKKYLRQPREEFLRGRPEIITELLPALVAAIDGTYHRCDKSSDFAIQLKSYSSQKKYNLVKSLSLMTANGRWWDVLGVFFSDSDHNDEMIWEYVWKNNLHDFKSVIDVILDYFLADRYLFYSDLSLSEPILALCCPEALALSPSGRAESLYQFPSPF